MNKVIKDLGMKIKPGTVKRARFVLIECPICKTHFEIRKDYIKNKIRNCKSCASKIGGLDPRKTEKITQSIIKEFFIYDYDSGKLLWKKKTSQKSNNIINTEAGSLYPQGYRRIRFRGKYYPTHHLVWMYEYGYFPEMLDHIDHIRDNNRLNNLQLSTSLENGKNVLMKTNNSSGFNGVSYNKRDKVWTAYIGINNKTILLGNFKRKQDAIKARKTANIKYKFSQTHGTII